MESKETVDAIGQAWIAFRKGQFDAAGTAFESIVSRQSDSIDAHYGLGLVRRAQGNRGTAVEEFHRCRTLVARAFAENPKSDRMEIMQRMVDQRIAELTPPRS
ncbi:MAG: hypothetical protein SGJ24_07505 [Chloroflexota bacterium]|nr:hypothetical protein [Chloroflexota bacterium]